MKKRFILSFILPFVGAIPLIIIATNEEYITEKYGESVFLYIMIGSVIMIMSVIMFPVFGLLKNLFSGGGYRMFWGNGKVAAQILETGDEAIATIISVGENSKGGVLTINDQPVLNLVFSVKKKNLNAYEISMDILVPRAAVPQLQPGAQIPVKVDRQDNSKIVFDQKRVTAASMPKVEGKGWSELDREMVEKNGKDGMVTIIGVEDTGKSEDFKPVILLVFDVQTPGETVYRVKKELAIASEMIVKFQSVTGKSFKAKIHPNDKEKVSMDIIF
jgi:hypothetical protein